VLAAFAVGLGLALLASLGGSEPTPEREPAPAADADRATSAERPARAGAARRREREPIASPRAEPQPEHEHVEEGPSGPPPASTEERAAAAAVRAYVRALAARDARALCAAFAPGALAEARFPRERGSCERTLAASLGYRDPRGLPVWRTSRLAGAISARVDGERARVVATVLTRYANDREPSVEDDIIYLERRAGSWRLSRPSATFYRAIGVAELPPSALAPPD